MMDMDNMNMKMKMDQMDRCGHLSIGMEAPDFTANTTFGPIRFSDYRGKWVVFFSHPGDFTPEDID